MSVSDPDDARHSSIRRQEENRRPQNREHREPSNSLTCADDVKYRVESRGSSGNRWKTRILEDKRKREPKSRTESEKCELVVRP